MWCNSIDSSNDDTSNKSGSRHELVTFKSSQRIHRWLTKSYCQRTFQPWYGTASWITGLLQLHCISQFVRILYIFNFMFQSIYKYTHIVARHDPIYDISTTQSSVCLLINSIRRPIWLSGRNAQVYRSRINRIGMHEIESKVSRTIFIITIKASSLRFIATDPQTSNVNAPVWSISNIIQCSITSF